MNTSRLRFLVSGLICWGLLSAAGAAFAQEEEAVVTGEDGVAGDSAVTNGQTSPAMADSEAPAVAPPEVQPAIVAPTPAPAAEIAPSRPAKTAAAPRGSDLGAAFKGADNSKFGISGRVNKMPAKKSPKREKGDWKSSLELGVNTASGNSETLRYAGAVKASKETEADYLYLKAAGHYGESDNEKDTQNATGEAKYQHRLTDRVYGAVDGYVLHDPIVDLSYRTRGSISLGRHFIWTERTVLSAEIGPGYVAEKKGDENSQYLAGRLAQYLEFLVTANLQVWQSVEYVPSLEDTATYFVNAEVGLETALVSNLSLRFVVEDRYDNAPADGKESNDLTTTTALAWSF